MFTFTREAVGVEVARAAESISFRKVPF